MELIVIELRLVEYLRGVPVVGISEPGVLLEETDARVNVSQEIPVPGHKKRANKIFLFQVGDFWDFFH